ncbi:protein serine/threonine kinase, putative [Entamoeba invadens IP1]|uniref:Protein serine/threonine kinase, putative n=1 Tax=Entamoeba invadens IP1 TaxID=370355 RepID=A0A0A1TUD8_ENTIV|nr:protein serine/threonine kinase, putative [Entamoeba invadens IP1]ELP83590.1 protein serine/threonine kinase, putative [Entamoeba invadens IP1]|eukprot:XP_004182936.1 protein serine/threonine kinase, putative [Entamoeba invadens IP1]
MCKLLYLLQLLLIGVSSEKCEAGYYLSEGNCVECKDGYYSVKGTVDECTKCNELCAACDKTNGNCTSCVGGCSFNGRSCLLCAAGYFSNGGTSSCTVCRSGSYSLGGASTCLSCDSTCGSCDKTNGNCTTCNSGYILTDGRCTPCRAGTYPSGDMCVKCPTNYYSSSGSISCTKCDTTCVTCNSTNGYCTSCQIGYATNNKVCTICASGYYEHNNACKPCENGTHSSTGGSTECKPCQGGYYSLIGYSECVHCDGLCGDHCDAASGKCLSCISGYVLQPTGECVGCEGGQYANTATNSCKLCAAGTYSEQNATSCTSCVEGHYSFEGATRCKACSSVCNTCDKTTGVCLTCYSGYQLNASQSCEICRRGTYSYGIECVDCEEMKYQSEEGQSLCLACNTNCASCDKTNGKCTTCKAGYGYDDGSCTLCHDGYYSTGGTASCMSCPVVCDNCIGESGVCSSCLSGYKKVGGECTSCASNGNCNSCDSDENESNRVCVECAENYYLNDKDNSCYLCNTIDPNCETCSRNAKVCVACSDDFVTNGTSCNKCGASEVKIDTQSCMKCYDAINNCNDCTSCVLGYTEGTHYNYITNTSILNDNNCVRQVNATCIQCKNSLLVNGSCIGVDSNCVRHSTTTCDVCATEIITTANCGEITDNCKYTKVVSGVGECLQCKSDELCGLQQQHCAISNNSFCYLAETGYSSTTNGIMECMSGSVCVQIGNNEIDYKCANSYVFDGKYKCHADVKCSITKSSDCVGCVTNHHIEDYACTQNTIANCEIQNKDICIKCDATTITSNGKCYSTDNLDCAVFDDVCKKCSADKYKTLEKCELIETQFPSCQSVIGEHCAECQINNNLIDGICVTNTLQNTTKSYFKFILNQLQNTQQKNYKSGTKTLLKLEENDASNCIEKSSKGCLRCADTYYIENGVCVKCEYPCTYCSNLTFCTKCDQYSYPNTNGNCTTLGEIITTCLAMMPNYDGCAICKDGYKRSTDGKSCDKCDESCATCDFFGNCIDCNNTFYRIDTNDKYCRPQSELIGCVNSSTYGCLICGDGYYLHTNVCDKCDDNCTLCTSLTECTSCVVTHILVDSQCVHFSSILNCVSASDNKCMQCADNFKVNTEGTQCDKKTNYGLVVVLPILCILLLVIILFIIIITTLIVIHRNHKKEQEKGICVFEMKRSNVSMKVLKNGVLTNKTEINYNDSNEFIPVEAESKELLCTGFACEFEVFLTPHCTLTLEDKIAVVTLDISTGEMATFPINLFVKTEKTTRLDFDDIVEEKKLGEGSFGIVYKGKYEGAVVAIKKMKEANNTTSSIAEFEKEVSMLDKFRSDYIIHFYGAVFIPNKICMVTEFAQFGSLQDLIKNKRSEEIETKLRVKMMIDAAKGILYLHENGILHRDIKPDNILVLSLDVNEKVNAKLTDFGSSRNINMLQTNMTFTKGIGTPKYMAPEVLDRKKYKKASDVYSFAMTMFEVFQWDFVFKKDDERFQHVWNIADFISNGKRFARPNNISMNEFDIIQNAWAQDPKDRIPIGKVIEKLEELNH